jgi:hypothetical protein
MALNNGINVVHELLLCPGSIVVNVEVIKISGRVFEEAKRSFFGEIKRTRK